MTLCNHIYQYLMYFGLIVLILNNMIIEKNQKLQILTSLTLISIILSIDIIIIKKNNSSKKKKNI